MHSDLALEHVRSDCRYLTVLPSLPFSQAAAAAAAGGAAAAAAGGGAAATAMKEGRRITGKVSEARRNMHACVHLDRFPPGWSTVPCLAMHLSGTSAVGLACLTYAYARACALQYKIEMHREGKEEERKEALFLHFPSLPFSSASFPPSSFPSPYIPILYSFAGGSI